MADESLIKPAPETAPGPTFEEMKVAVGIRMAGLQQALRYAGVDPHSYRWGVDKYLNTVLVRTADDSAWDANHAFSAAYLDYQRLAEYAHHGRSLVILSARDAERTLVLAYQTW